MADERKPPSEWARKRAAGKAARAKKIERREGFFDLLVSGYSVEQIATRTGLSPSAVRRAIDQAMSERRLDAPEKFAQLQVARLSKALRCADVSLERGDLSAVEPFLKVVSELNRLHGFGGVSLRLAPRAAAKEISSRPAAPLALAHAAPPLEPIAGENVESRVGEVLSS